jgi:hypothetical protein
VVSPGLGNAREAAAFARLIGAEVAAGAKQRYADDRVTISSVIGDVTGRDLVVLDDEMAKGSTVLGLLGRLRGWVALHARRLYARPRARGLRRDRTWPRCVPGRRPASAAGAAAGTAR